MLQVGVVRLVLKTIRKPLYSNLVSNLANKHTSPGQKLPVQEPQKFAPLIQLDFSLIKEDEVSYWCMFVVQCVILVMML